MTTKTLLAKAIHGSFTLERVYDASPARVFKAFADPEAKARWFIGPGGWDILERRLDFRPGGEEVVHGRLPGGVESRFVARYHEIVPEQRLVYVYDMHVNGGHMSVSLSTLELEARGNQTVLRYTENIVFVDGEDGTASRRHGTEVLFEQIAANMPD